MRTIPRSSIVAATSAFALLTVLSLAPGPACAQEKQAATVAAATPAKPEKSGDTTAATNKTPAIKFSAVRALIGGVDYGTRATLQAGPDKYGFQMPAGWLVRSLVAESRIVITHTEQIGTITLQYVAGQSDKELTFDSVRPALLARRERARLLEEYDGVAMGAKALIFEFAFTLGVDAWQEKTVVIPVESGRIIASVATPVQKKDTMLSTFQGITSSLLKAGPDGQVRFPTPTENP